MYSLLTIATIVILDQFFKSLIIKKVMLYTGVEIIKDFFYITHIENQGIAFGLFKNRNTFFVITTSIVIFFLLYLTYKFYNKNIMLTYCMSFIVGGALGNLIDRIKYGYVIDYLQFTFFPPVFNFADATIVCGAIVLSLLLFFDKNIVI